MKVHGHHLCTSVACGIAVLCAVLVVAGAPRAQADIAEIAVCICNTPGLCETSIGAICSNLTCFYPAAVGQPCNDGNPNTTNDTCTASKKCVGTPIPTPTTETFTPLPTLTPTLPVTVSPTSDATQTPTMTGTATTTPSNSPVATATIPPTQIPTLTATPTNTFTTVPTATGLRRIRRPSLPGHRNEDQHSNANGDSQ